jgi:hypothetical protein
MRCARTGKMCDCGTQPTITSALKAVNQEQSKQGKQPFFEPVKMNTVMKKENNNRCRWLTVRLNDEEYKALERYYRNSTCRALSEYARNLLLRKPITLYYRNATGDELLSVLIEYKNSLTTIEKSFGQMTKKLSSMESTAEVKVWALLNEASKQELFKKVEEIKNRLNQFYQLWCHE